MRAACECALLVNGKGEKASRLPRSSQTHHGSEIDSSSTVSDKQRLRPRRGTATTPHWDADAAVRQVVGRFGSASTEKAKRNAEGNTLKTDAPETQRERCRDACGDAEAITKIPPYGL
ncbi:unnamed protein product [Lampetra planeri]